MIFKAMFIGVLAIAASAVIALTGCTGPRYEEGSPPHESWKDRGEYCFAVEVDPRGEDNATYFWADEVEVGYADNGESSVRARDVRVADYNSDGDNGRGSARSDFYQPGIVRVIEDGSIEIDERCYE